MVGGGMVAHGKGGTWQRYVATQAAQATRLTNKLAVVVEATAVLWI